MSHDNFQPPDVDVPPQDDEDRIYYALTDLASLDTDDVNLRDHPKAYEVLDRLMTHAYAEGRNDAAAEIARLQAQLAASQAQVVELADALAGILASTAQGLPPYEHGIEAQIAWVDRIAAARRAGHAALSKVGRDTNPPAHPAEADASAAVRESHDAAWAGASSVIYPKD